jgi:hypothetical protein
LLPSSNISFYRSAETYPTEIRATCHGISAFLGKAGALFATVIFHEMKTSQIFLMCGGTSIVGLLLTFLFSVDLTHVPLAEHDAQLELFLEDRLDVYKGRLNAPQHLSVFERWTGRHGEYDPKWASRLMEQEEEKQTLSSKVLRHRRMRTLSSQARVRELFAGINDETKASTPRSSRHKRRRQSSGQSGNLFDVVLEEVEQTHLGAADEKSTMT